MHLRERRRATVAFRLHGHQRYHHVFFAKDMMNLDGEDTPAQCQGVFVESYDLVVALVIARQRTVTRHMPGDGCVEYLKDRGDIAIGEIVVRLTDDGSWPGSWLLYNTESCFVSRKHIGDHKLDADCIARTDIGWLDAVHRVEHRSGQRIGHRSSFQLIRRALIARRRLLANDFLCFFVRPQPEKHRLAQLVIMSPLGELDLGDKHGFYPLATFNDGRGDS